MNKKLVALVIALVMLLIGTGTVIMPTEIPESSEELSLILVEENIPYDKNIEPEVPPQRLHPTVEVESPQSSENYISSTETVSLTLQTYLTEEGVQVLPWELLDNLSTVREFSYSRGPLVSVDAFLATPDVASYFELNDGEVTLITDLEYLYIIHPHSDELPRPALQRADSDASIMSNAPWGWRRLEVVQLNWAGNVGLVIGDIQIAAQVISNGSQTHLFNATERTGAFPNRFDGSNLRLIRGPNIIHNNTAHPHIETNFEATLTTNFSRNIIFALYYNAQGNVSSHIATGIGLSFRIK